MATDDLAAKLVDFGRDRRHGGWFHLSTFLIELQGREHALLVHGFNSQK
jgi:hypothetical protein